MTSEYQHYQSLLESRFNKDIKEIITDVYITRGLGPSMGAKELDIPRPVFIYFHNFYGLRELKHATQDQYETH